MVDAVIALPVLPAGQLGPVLAMNEDVGETIGWPDLVRTVARVERAAPGAVILTHNYGEAGAIDRLGPPLGLPRAFSGHNAYGDWGPPPDGSAPVIAVGLRRATLDEHLRRCRAAARIANDDDVDNEEQGRPVLVCSGPRRPWLQKWASLRHLGYGGIAPDQHVGHRPPNSVSDQLPQDLRERRQQHRILVQSNPRQRCPSRTLSYLAVANFHQSRSSTREARISTWASAPAVRPDG